MMIIDTHVHYNSKELLPNWKQLWKDAQDSGVKQSIIVGDDAETSIQACEIAETDSNLFASIGFHPTDAQETDTQILEELLQKHRKKIVAMGETGLDFYRLAKDPIEEQEEKVRQKTVFMNQIQLAKTYTLPLIIHSRNAYPDILDVLNLFAKDNGMLPPAVLHCMSGPMQYLLDALHRGLHISFAGNVTFNNAKELQELAKQTPLDRLFLETDAPYLTPEPLRGQFPNQPKNIAHTAQYLAKLYTIDLSELCRITTENAQRFFGLPKPE